MTSESSNNWIEIAKFSGAINAEIAETILKENNIPSFTKVDFFSSAYNIKALSLPGGSVKLFIPESYKVQAEDLLQNILSENE